MIPCSTVLIALALLAAADAGAPQKQDKVPSPAKADATTKNTAKPKQPPAFSGPSDLSDANLQAQLKLERSKAENLVLEVAANFKEDTAEYKKAKALYGDAQIHFNAFTSTLLDAYVAKQKVDLTKTANEAAGSAQTFATYVASLNPEAKSPALIPVIASALVDIGEKLWSFFSDRAQAKRQKFADTVRKQVTWQKWSAIASP